MTDVVGHNYYNKEPTFMKYCVKIKNKAAKLNAAKA